MAELGLPWLICSVVSAFVVLVARLAPAGKSFRLSLPEVLAASIPVGIVASAWMVFITACLTSAIGNHTVFASVLFMAYLVFEHAEEFSRNIGPLVRDFVAPHALFPNMLLSLVMAVAGAILTPLYDTRMLKEEGPGRVFSGGSCWADLPMHMTVAESFINGRNQDVSWSQMVSPIFAGDTMAYPFLPDFHAAVMVKMGGVNLRWAFLATGLPLALAMTALLFTLSHRLTRSALGSALAVLLVYGTGGMGGWNLARRDGWDAVASADVVQNDVSGEGKAVWFAFLPHVLLPQRGANFAYPLALVVLTLVWVATEWGSGGGRGAHGSARGGALTLGDRAHLLTLAGLLAGALPLVQAHSFIAVAVIIGTVFVLDAHKWLANPRLLLAWGGAGLAAAAVALPQLRLFSDRVGSGAGGKFIQLGWWYVHHDSGRAGGLLGFFSFWWLNLGPGLVTMLAALAAGAAECYGALEAARSAPPVLAKVKTLERLAEECAEYSELAPAAPVGAAAVVGAGAGAGAAGAGGGGFTSLAAAAAAAAAAPSPAKKAGRAAAAGAEEEEEEEEGEEGEGGGAAAAAPPPGARVATAFAAAPAPAPALPAGAAAAAEEEPHFLWNLVTTLVANLREDSGGYIDLEKWADVSRYASRGLDLGYGFWMNRASLSGRGFDALKFSVGAFNVFLLGNYVMFQPWDRDNCKMWYVGLFVTAASVGALLAAPLEALLFAAAPSALPAGALLGFHRLLALSGAPYARALWLAQPVSGGLEGLEAGALPLECYSEADRVRLPALEAGAPGASADAKSAEDKRLEALRARLARGGAPAVSFANVRAPVGLLALVGAGAAAGAFFFSTLSGFLMIRREFGLYHQLLDKDQFEMAAYIKEHVPPKAVIVHRDIHISPVGCLSGRISLVGYNGWMWSHGYNYHERDRDRGYVLENALKDSDTQAYNLLRRWGVRYVLGEHLATHARPSKQAWEAARARIDSGEAAAAREERRVARLAARAAARAAAAAAAAEGGNGTNATASEEGEAAEEEEPEEALPAFDEDAFLDGQLKRVKRVGRYDLLEVQGYGFPPV